MLAEEVADLMSWAILSKTKRRFELTSVLESEAPLPLFMDINIPETTPLIMARTAR
ncbi:MAG: hypothetical protein UU18_C0019G0004 [Parcubacteria group bacterium GW2011_GWB2_40_8]|nr:MAG: hypothetical protein UU18_C0019G0004 [Parcubacteria group bacterium GW2011_GWB2_40_8]